MHPLVAPSPIFPVQAFPPQSAKDATTEDILYEIVASTSLPVIDISRSVRTEFFNHKIVTGLHRFMSRHRRSLFVAYNIGLILTNVGLLGPEWLGRLIAFPMLVCGVSGPVVQALYMRYDIVLILLKTYDFWFFSTLWFVAMLLFAISLGDIRALIASVTWMAMQVTIMTDASVSHRSSVLLTSLALVTSLVLIAAIGVGAIDEMKDFVILTVNGFVIGSGDVIVNGWSTCVLVLVRTIFRRRAALRNYGGNKTVVQCISYRCRVRLRGCARRRRSGSSLSSTNSISSVSSVQITRPTASYFQNAKMVRMRCMRVKTKFSARNLVLPWARRLLQTPDNSWVIRVMRGVLIALAQASAILSLVGYLPSFPANLHILPLVMALIVVSLSLAITDRQLLKYSVFSFDFAFLSFQLTATHIGMCDLYQWDTRRYLICTSWLWAHWLISFDCIPPVLKNKIKIRLRYVLWIGMFFVLGHLGVFAVLAFGDPSAFYDREFVQMKFKGYEVTFRVLPMVVSRMIMTFGWSCRIVWRLAWRNENELVIIQGTVTYINNRRRIVEQQTKFEQGLEERAKPIVKQLTRQVTRRASAFATAITPAPSALSVTEEASAKQDPVEPLEPSAKVNPRLSRFYAGPTSLQPQSTNRGLASQLQYQQRVGASRLKVFDASNEPSALFETVDQSRLGHLPVRSDDSEMNIPSLDTSLQTVPQPFTASENSDNSRSSENDPDERPRFVI